MVSFLYETKQARQEKNHTKTNCSHLLLSKTTQMQKHSEIFIKVTRIFNGQSVTEKQGL